MNFNSDMWLREANHLAIARPFIQPGVACFMPRTFMCGSKLPDWKGTTVFFLATPKLGAKFIEATLHIEKDGGSAGRIECDCEHFMFVLEGSAELILYGKRHILEKHGYFWVPPGADFELHNLREETTRVLWVRKNYILAPRCSVPKAIVSNIQDVKQVAGEAALVQCCLPQEVERGFDMGMNLLTFVPGVTFSRVETHACEHGNYFISGRGIMSVNGRYSEVFPDDFCYVAPYALHMTAAFQPEPLTFMLYKDANREFPL